MTLNTIDRTMADRIARFADLKAADFSKMRGSENVPKSMALLSVIGYTSTKDIPAIIDDHGFTLSLLKVPPGVSVPLHSHLMVEVFVPINSRWKFFWGENGEHETELGPLDTISVPAGMKEGIRNLGHEEGILLIILGSSDIGDVNY